MTESDSDEERVWLVERTFSDEEQNLIVLRYATEDGSAELVQEQAVPSTTGDVDAEVSVTTEPKDLREVDDDETQQQYAEEAQRVQEHHEIEDRI